MLRAPRVLFAAIPPRKHRRPGWPGAALCLALPAPVGQKPESGQRSPVCDALVDRRKGRCGNLSRLCGNGDFVTLEMHENKPDFQRKDRAILGSMQGFGPCVQKFANSGPKAKRALVVSLNHPLVNQANTAPTARRGEMAGMVMDVQ